MTIFLWYLFGTALFLFYLLNYILVVYLHGEHASLYRELGEPSAFHFAVRQRRYFTHPYTLFILRRRYRKELRPFRGLYALAQWIFASFCATVISALALAMRYA